MQIIKFFFIKRNVEEAYHRIFIWQKQWSYDRLKVLIRILRGTIVQICSHKTCGIFFFVLRGIVTCTINGDRLSVASRLGNVR